MLGKIGLKLSVALQVAGHAVEGGGQFSEFIAAGDLHLSMELTTFNVANNCRHVPDRVGENLGGEKNHQNRQAADYNGDSTEAAENPSFDQVGLTVKFILVRANSYNPVPGLVIQVTDDLAARLLFSRVLPGVADPAFALFAHFLSMKGVPFESLEV